jgi:hypothetical protein
MDHKQRANKQKRFRSVIKKGNVEVGNLVSSGGQGECMKYIGFPWPPLEAVLPILNFRVFSFC